MAETMLVHGPAARDGGERYQVVVTVGADTLAGAGPGGGGELDDGPWLSSEVARRLACDSTVVAMSLGDGGEPLSVGRATPSIPRHIRRALRKRDEGCHFPGCGQRHFVDGHHIVHWAHGGETSLANLCLLCRFHHHAVHEGGFGLERTPTGKLVFTTPGGEVLAAAPEIEPVALDIDDVNRRLGVVIGSGTGASLWGGERLDLGLTVDPSCASRAASAPDPGAGRGSTSRRNHLGSVGFSRLGPVPPSRCPRPPGWVAPPSIEELEGSHRMFPARSSRSMATTHPSAGIAA